MPKKRTYNFTPYTTASSSPKPAGKDVSASTTSVNERLLALRLEDTPEGLAKKRALAETVNQRSVHPSVRGLLGQEESAPPKPKAGVRIRERFTTPGPAAPKSWVKRAASGSGVVGLTSGRRKRFKSRKDDRFDQRCRPQVLQRFAHMVGSPVELRRSGLPKLSHLTLKLLAGNWNLFGEEDYPALIELPLHLRLQLLSYLGYLGPTIDVKALHALTQGGEAVQSLDLAGLACHGQLTLRRLTKFVKECEESNRSRSDLVVGDDVLDSWDTDEVGQPSLSALQLTPNFSGLTHLSLSHPPPTASWGDLLALATHVPQLTHLSLAYWPRPTLTPNLATTTVSSTHSPDVTAGGSHHYSALDEDMDEPGVLLRRLSARLLCLRWLDLEGCHDWVSALAFDATGLAYEYAWTRRNAGPSVCCMDNWHSLTYINMSQGDCDRLLNTMHSEILASLCHQPGGIEINRDWMAFDARAAAQGIKPSGTFGDGHIQVWRDREKQLMNIGEAINNLRRSKRCSPATIDFGWRRSRT